MYAFSSDLDLSNTEADANFLTADQLLGIFQQAGDGTPVPGLLNTGKTHQCNEYALSIFLANLSIVVSAVHSYNAPICFSKTETLLSIEVRGNLF